MEELELERVLGEVFGGEWSIPLAHRAAVVRDFREMLADPAAHGYDPDDSTQLLAAKYSDNIGRGMLSAYAQHCVERYQRESRVAMRDELATLMAAEFGDSWRRVELLEYDGVIKRDFENFQRDFHDGTVPDLADDVRAYRSHVEATVGPDRLPNYAHLRDDRGSYGLFETMEDLSTSMGGAGSLDLRDRDDVHLTYNPSIGTSWCSQRKPLATATMTTDTTKATCPQCKMAYQITPKLFWFICIQGVREDGTPITWSKNGTIVPFGRTTGQMFKNIRDAECVNAGLSSDGDRTVVLAFTIGPNIWAEL